MKGYTSFYDIDRPAADTGMKYFDWERAEQICKDNSDATIKVGLREDWGHTSEIVYRQGQWIKKDYTQGCSLFALSRWATPIIDIDGKEIECYLDSSCPEEKMNECRPKWWGRGEAIILDDD